MGWRHQRRGRTRGLQLTVQAPRPLGMNWNSSAGTCSKNALCSLCGKGHRTGAGCWLVYQFLQPPTQTVPGKAVPSRARNFSVAATVGETAAWRLVSLKTGEEG
jgi:hypothetical protein